MLKVEIAETFLHGFHGQLRLFCLLLAVVNLDQVTHELVNELLAGRCKSPRLKARLIAVYAFIFCLEDFPLKNSRVFKA